MRIFTSSDQNWRGLFLLAISVSGIGAVYVGFLTTPELRLSIYLSLAHVFSFLSLVLLVGLGTAYLYFGWKNRTGILFDAGFAVLLTIIISQVVAGRPLIETDSSIMVATSYGIYYSGTPLAPTAGIYDANGQLVVLQATLDKRGTLYPSVIALLHSVFGPSANNGVAANLLFCWLALAVTMRFGRRFLSTKAVMLSAVFLAATPLFTLHARSGTIDVSSLAVLLLLIHVSLSFWLNPRLLTFLFVVSIAAVLGQLRYEAGAFGGLLVVLFLLAIVFGNRFESVRRPQVWIVPWLFIPAAFRRVIPFNYELPPGQQEAWSLDNFLFNVPDLLRYFYTGGAPTGTGNSVVFFLALIGAASLIFKPKGKVALVFLLACIGALTTLQLTYFWGTTQVAQTVRYFLPLCVAIALVAALTIDLLPSRASTIACLLVGCAVVGLAIGPTRKPHAFNNLTFSRNIELIISRTASTTVHCGYLVDTERALPLLVRGFSFVPTSAGLNRDSASRIAGRELQVWSVPDLYTTLPSSMAAAIPSIDKATCSSTPTAIEWSKDPPLKLHF